MNIDDVITFGKYHWALVEAEEITIGLTDDFIADLGELISIDLPEEGEAVAAEDVVGTLETNNGPINLYSPAAGQIIEVNEAVKEDISTLESDPSGEGWLFKMEADDVEEISQLISGDSLEFEVEED